MGTLTGSAISSTYESLLLTDKTSSGVGDIYYSNGANPDVKLTTLTSALTFTGKITASAGIQLTNNIIYNSEGTEALTLDSDEDLTIAGDLKVTGNIISSSTGDAITLSGTSAAITGDLTVTGNDIKSSGGTTAITFSGANSTLAGDLTVSGGDATINQTSGAATLLMSSDNSADSGDDWTMKANADHTFTMGNDKSGGHVAHITITPNATVASSTFKTGGILQLGGDGLKSSAGGTVFTTTGSNIVFQGDIDLVAGDIDFAADREIKFASGDFAINDASQDALLFTKTGATMQSNYRIIVAGGLTQTPVVSTVGTIHLETTHSSYQFANAAGGVVAYVLPEVATSGVRFKIMVSDFTGNVTVTTDGSETMLGGVGHIDGAANSSDDSGNDAALASSTSTILTMTAPYEGTYVELISNGTNWFASGLVLSDTAPAFN